MEEKGFPGKNHGKKKREIEKVKREGKSVDGEIGDSRKHGRDIWTERV